MVHHLLVLSVDLIRLVDVLHLSDVSPDLFEVFSIKFFIFL